MIIQKWSVRTKPMQLSDFVLALKRLNEIYQQSGRKPWARLHHELFGGHFIQMEREFPDLAALTEDENKDGAPEIRKAKTHLLEFIVEGTVQVSVFQTVIL